MPPLERLWDERNRRLVLVVSGGWIVVVAIVDRLTAPYSSLGFLYLFPIVLAAGFLPRWIVVLLSVICSVLSELFSSLSPSLVRPVFETLALASCGLFVGELIRNRRLSTAPGEAETTIPVEPRYAATLSARESAVLRPLVQGLANKEIAAEMAVSEGVVKNIMLQLFSKAGVRTRSQLVRVALEQYRNRL